MTTTEAFHIRELRRDEIEALLTRNNVGRLAFSHLDRVDIEPINYVYANGWVYCRTSHGVKMDIIEHHPWVAFEVDEVKGVFEWQSVVVRGAVYALRHDSPESDRHAFTPGLTLLRHLVPGTLEADDPVPFRGVVFRIHLDEVTGREARPGDPPAI